jgi:hypothetical protein
MTQFVWKTGVNGTWDTAGDWVGGAYPNSNTADVTIASGAVDIAPGTSFTVDSVTLTAAAATLEVQGILNLGGTLDRLTVGSGTLDLASGGTIANGTIIAGTGAVSFGTNAMLDNVTYIGNLNIATGAQVDTEIGLVVKTAAGGTPGTINIADSATFDAETNSATNETLNSVVINLGSSAGGAVFGHDILGGGGALVLGSLVTLNVTGANDRLYDDGGATIINNGVFNVGGAGFFLQGGNSFNNAGTINIAAGASLTENESTFTNTGTIKVGGSLVLDSNVTLSSATGISLGAAGVLDSVGTLSLNGLSLGLTQGIFAGAFANGTIKAGGGTFASNSMLENITYVGDLNIAAGKQLDTAFGLVVETAAGGLPGTINIADSATFDAETNTAANETLNNVIINLGASAGGAVFGHDIIGGGGALVLGSGVTLNVTGANDRLYDDGGATIINNGVFNVGGAGFLLQGGNSFNNAGTINIATGASLTASETTFTNTGLINVGGTLFLDSNATLAPLGRISLSPAGFLDAVGTLSLAGATLALPQGTLGGVLANGTIVAGGGTFATNAFLDAITYVGDLNIASGQQLNTAFGLVVETAAGGLPGTINVADSATFDAETNSATNETLNNVIINLGASAGGAVFGHDIIGGGGALVLGSGVTLNVIGANDRLYDDGGATIINNGVFNVGGAGFLLQGGNSFNNAGTINIAAGASLTENESTFTNTGHINVGGSLVLDSRVTLSSATGISLRAAGVLDAVGTLVLGGLNLTLAQGIFAGGFANGTITGGAGTLASNTMLDAITYLGNLSIASGQVLETRDSLTVKTAAGKLPGTIFVGDNAIFDAETSTGANETLNSIVINLGASTGGAVFEHDLIGGGGQLVLGKAVTVNVTGANDRFFDDGGATLINDGIINVGGTGFLIQGGSTFTNAGTINIKAGDSLNETTGTFTNTGLIEGTGAGTVSVAIGGFNFHNLAGTILTGGSFEANAADTLALNLPGLFTTADATLILNGAGSEITEYSSTIGSYVALEAELAAIGTGGTLEVLGGRGFSTAKSLALSGGVLDLGGGTFAAAGLVSNGKGVVEGFGVVKANETGKVSLHAVGGALDFSADTLAFLAGTTLAAGNALEADLASTLKLANNLAIAVDAGSITLSGTNSVIESLNTGTASEITLDNSLGSVAVGGALSLLAGRSFTAAANGGSFSNAGKLTLGGGTFSAASLTEASGAVLTGAGTVAGPISNAGTILASGGTLILGGALSGTGTLSAAAKAVLDLTGGGGFAGALTGAGTIKIDGALTLNAGSSLAATNVVEDANLTLGAGTAITNSAGHGFTIAAASGTVTLGGSGTLTNAGTLSKTGAGEADIGATFINSASVSVGAGKMVFVGGVTGSGSVGIAAGAIAAFVAGASASQKVNFLAGSGALNLGSPASFLGLIGGFTGSDSIDLLNTAATKLSYTGGTLTVLNGSSTVATLAFNGTYTLNNFVLGSDHNGGSQITWQA